MGTSSVLAAFAVLDGLTDSQLRLAAAYARDALRDRKQQRAQAHRQAQNAPLATEPIIAAAPDRTKPATQQG